MQRAICSWHKAQPGRLWQREAHKAGGSIRMHATLAKVAMAVAAAAPELQSCAALVGNISGRRGKGIKECGEEGPLLRVIYSHNASMASSMSSVVV